MALAARASGVAPPEGSGSGCGSAGLSAGSCPVLIDVK